MYKASGLILSGLGLLVGACSSNENGVDTGSGSSVGGHSGWPSGGESGNLGGAAYAGNGGLANTGTAGTGNSGIAGNVNTAGNANNGGSGANPGIGGSGASIAAGGNAGNSANANGGSCQAQTGKAANVPPILEFAIDVTGSMAMDPANPSAPNGPKKWDVFSQTMPTVFGSLPPNYAIGVSYFRKPDTACFQPDQAVPIGILDATQLTRVNASLQGRTVQGATPTYAAWKYALDTLVAWDPPAAYSQSPRYIVLITDGVPTVNADGCTYVNPITQAEYDSEIRLIQQEGDAAGVKTFVVGVVGSENPQNATYDPLYMLSKVAIAGGTEQPPGCIPVTGTPAGTTVNPRGSYCHFDMSTTADFSASLISVLSQVAKQVATCSFSVPNPGATYYVDLPHTEVSYTSSSSGTRTLASAPNSDCTQGGDFYLNDPNNATQLFLCPTMCDVLQADPGASVTVTFACGKIG